MTDVKQAALIARRANQRWLTKTGTMSDTDGFQVDVVEDDGETQLMVTLYGGACFVGEPRKVEAVCRHHVIHRVRRHKASSAAPRHVTPVPNPLGGAETHATCLDG
jgi:hypothetical protein